MGIYRVTIIKELLVEAKNHTDAEKVGFKFLNDEYSSNLYKIEEVNSLQDLRKDEGMSIPWSLNSRFQSSEKTLNEILSKK